MDSPKRIAIIGGGIAGLSAGIYAQRHGFRTTIYEKNTLPGGACMGWMNGQLPIEGNMSFLVGAGEDTALYRCWNEVGALENTMFVHPDSLFTLEDSGEVVEFSQDLEQFCRNAEKISPEDRTLLHRFCEAVLKAEEYELPVSQPEDLAGPLKSRHFNSANGEIKKMLTRLRSVSLSDFAEQFHHPALRCAFLNVLPQGSTLAALVLFYGKFISGDLAVPVGGSRKLTERMVSFYQTSGGELRLNTPVKEIIVANGAARGVVLENGERLLTHWVIAACDPEYTHRVLLQDRYTLEKKLQVRYENPEIYPTFSRVRLFFSAPVDCVPLARVFSFPTDDIPAAGDGISRLTVTQYSDDPSFVKNGRTELVAEIPMTGKRAFRYWAELAVQQDVYEEAIDRLAGAVQFALEKRFPRMKGQLQFLTCHTPVTYAERLHVYHGSCTAFVPTSHARLTQLTGRIPGLKKFLLTGQWLGNTAGMHTALVQGKFTAERLCHDEQIQW